jgi:hypothetical protein
MMESVMILERMERCIVIALHMMDIELIGVGFGLDVS